MVLLVDPLRSWTANIHSFGVSARILGCSIDVLTLVRLLWALSLEERLAHGVAELRELLLAGMGAQLRIYLWVSDLLRHVILTHHEASS